MNLNWPFALTLFTAFALFGCEKKAQDAMVIRKDYIPAHVEGTEYQERQTDKEQWWIKIEMTDGRKADAPVDLEEWNALNVGDRVRANYKEGKYTGTIWAIELKKQ